MFRAIFRPAGVIGIVFGGALWGFLACYDIDPALGRLKLPFYVAMGALFGWLGGMCYYIKDNYIKDAQPTEGPYRIEKREELAEALERAAKAEQEIRRLQARIAELERQV